MKNVTDGTPYEVKQIGDRRPTDGTPYVLKDPNRGPMDGTPHKLKERGELR